MKQFVSIIVPVRNMERTIGTTFEYLMKVDYPRSKMEIIFSDGGSSDKTVSVIKEYQKEIDKVLDKRLEREYKVYLKIPWYKCLITENQTTLDIF